MLTLLIFVKRVSLITLLVVALLWIVAGAPLPNVSYVASVAFLLTWAASEALRRRSTKRTDQP